MPAKLCDCDHIIISFHLSRAFALYIAHGETKRDFLEFVHLRIAHSFLDRFPRYSLHSSISTSFHRKFTYLNSNLTAAIKSNSYGRERLFQLKTENLSVISYHQLVELLIHSLIDCDAHEGIKHSSYTQYTHTHTN